MGGWAEALSGIAGGLAGGAAAVGQVADDQIKMNNQLLSEQRAADVKLDLQQRLLAAEDMMKQRAADRFMTARQGIVDQKLGQKYAQSDAAVADASAGNTDAPLTDEQQAAIAQARAIDTDKLNTDDEVISQAGLASATMTPKDVAEIASRGDIAQMRQEQFKDRTAMMGQIAETRAQALRDIAEAKLDAAKEKAAKGAISASTKTMLITSEDANIKAATSEMGMLTRQLDGMTAKDPQRAAINDRIQELKDDIKQSKANKNAYMQDLGILPASAASGAKPGGAPSPAPAPAAGAKPANVPGLKADPLGLFGKK